MRTPLQWYNGKIEELIVKMPITNAANLKDIDIPLFLEAVKKFEGQLYCWPEAYNNYSGKGLSTARYKDCHDCSGTVTDGLFHSTNGLVDLRTNTNAQGLFNATLRVDSPKAGDLCFYGSSPQHVSHVMVRMDNGTVFGASGGDHRTVTPEIARKMNANVRYESNVHYRHDFVAFGRFK